MHGETGYNLLWDVSQEKQWNKYMYNKNKYSEMCLIEFGGCIYECCLVLNYFNCIWDFSSNSDKVWLGSNPSTMTKKKSTSTFLVEYLLSQSIFIWML